MLEMLFDMLREVAWWCFIHISQILVIGGILIVSFIGWWRWKRRDFHSWVNVCLHLVRKEEGEKRSLLLRDLHNVSVDDLANGNTRVAKILISSAKRATDGSPLLPLPPDGQKIILNMVRGFVSGLFREGFLAQDLQARTEGTWYVLGLICETKADIRRITVIVIKREILESSLLADSNIEWNLEHEKHEGRLNTLRLLRNRFLAEVGGEFVEIELRTRI